MSFLSIVALALALAMDAVAVAAARGLAADRVRVRDVALVAAFFGGAQAGMPLAGWALGVAVGRWVTAWNHIIAFVVLAAIGGKMIWEARQSGTSDALPAQDAFSVRVLAALAVATSIDALAAGVTLSLMHAPLLPSVVVIGVVTSVLSGAAVLVGRRLGAAVGRRLDAFGGLVLLGLGLKILLAGLRA